MNFDTIQHQIGYTFRNEAILKQAFTTTSFANEHEEESNAVLGWIGDRELDKLIAKWLVDQASEWMPSGEWCCTYSKEMLTNIKSYMVENKMLEKRMCALGFHACLRQGNGDVQKEAENCKLVKANLFEAIIGAVAIDSDWNEEILQQVVETMLDPEERLREYQNRT